MRSFAPFLYYLAMIQINFQYLLKRFAPNLVDKDYAEVAAALGLHRDTARLLLREYDSPEMASIRMDTVKLLVENLQANPVELHLNEFFTFGGKVRKKSKPLPWPEWSSTAVNPYVRLTVSELCAKYRPDITTGYQLRIACGFAPSKANDLWKGAKANGDSKLKVGFATIQQLVTGLELNLGKVRLSELMAFD